MTLKNALREWLLSRRDHEVLFFKDILLEMDVKMDTRLHPAALRVELGKLVKRGLLNHHKQSPIYIVTALALVAVDKPGWEWTDEEIVALWSHKDAAGTGGTFLTFRKDAKEILEDYDRWGRYDSERVWAVQGALLYGRQVPAAVLTRYQVYRQEWEVVK